MTNDPRDEFDRVPEFSNRSGSHRENGWAAAASVGGARSGLRWLMVFGALALVVGLFSFMVLPKLMGTSNDPAPVAASSSASTKASEEPTVDSSADSSETPSESSTESESMDSDSTEPSDTTGSSDESQSSSPGQSDFPEDVDPTTTMGVYNGSNIGGVAGTARTTLLDAGYSNVVASDWTKKVTYSTVYYRSETYRATAEAAAKELGLTSIMQSADIPGNIAIVLGNTYQ